MSADSGELRKGKPVYHNKIKKIVKDWFFTSNGGCHNSDLICISFEDGTTTGREGFTNIDYVWEREQKQKKPRKFRI